MSPSPAAVLVWGWLEISFYMGVRHRAASASAAMPGCTGWRHFGHALQASLYHELAIVVLGGGVVVALTWGAPNQFGTVDLRGAVVDAPERQAERVPRRAAT